MPHQNDERLKKRHVRPHRECERGLTLPEVLVSVTVFVIILLATYMIYERAQATHVMASSATGQQQDMRLAFGTLVGTIRDGGKNINPIGDKTLSDEWIEGAFESALFLRSDFDGEREPALEGTGAGEHPYVTTGNDEIVGFVLLDAANSQSLTLELDLTSSSGKRDSSVSGSTNPAGEETKTLNVAATTLAQQTAPPYSLYRVTFDDAGNAEMQLLHENVFQLRFRYYDESGAEVTAPGGGDGTSNANRLLRKGIRGIDIDLIGMSGQRFMNYTDPVNYSPDPVSAKPHRKFRLAERVATINVAKKGEDHGPIPPTALDPPSIVTACGGHCNTLVVSWAAVTGVNDYQIRVTTTDPSDSYEEMLPHSGSTSKIITVPDATLEYQIQIYSFDPVLNVLSPEADSPFTTITPSHDTTNNIPGTPASAATAAQDGTNYALRVQWQGVDENVGAITGAVCSTSDGTSTTLMPPMDQRLIDLAAYEVHRVPVDGTNVGGFDLIADTRIDDGSHEGGLDYSDATAAPCQGYFYRIRPLDKCGLQGGASPAMSAPASYDLPSDVVPDAPASLGAASATATVDSFGNPIYDITLQWPAVTLTSTGTPVTVHHYIVRRERKLATQSVYSYDGEFDVYGAITVRDTPFATSSGETASYRYTIQAQFDCGVPRPGAFSPPYVFPCTPVGAAAISSPDNGQTFSRPVGDSTPVGVSVTGTWTKAAVRIQSAASATVAYNQTLVQTVTDGTFNLPDWDNAAFPDGSYVLIGEVYQNDCVTALSPVTIDLDTVTCGLAEFDDATYPRFTNSDKSMEFKIENTCETAIVINGFTAIYSGGPNGSSNDIKKVKLNGNDIFDGCSGSFPGGGCADSGDRMDFSGLTLNGSTVSGVFHLEYDQELRSGTNQTTWTSLIVHTDQGDFDIGPITP